LRGSPAGTDAGGTRHGRRLGARSEHPPTSPDTTLSVGLKKSAALSKAQIHRNFVSVQRTIEDFITTRNAMNASSAQLQNPSITDTVNNGINEFIFVAKRANYILPTRPNRSFPLLPGRQQALD
jgi:hypothetical protein